MKPTARLLPFLMLLLGGVNASAQGFYYNVYLDGSYIGAVDEGYPYDGVSCDSITVWNELNGNYLSAGSVYPNVATLTNTVFAASGASFPWTIGFDIVVPNPLGGCSSSSSNFTTLLRLTTTYYGPSPTVTEHTGYVDCAYTNLACTSGTPTCTGGTPGIGFTMGGCPAYLKAEYLVVFGECTFSIASDAGTQGGACT
jgi:hypothetical protein